MVEYQVILFLGLVLGVARAHARVLDALDTVPEWQMAPRAVVRMLAVPVAGVMLGAVLR